MTPTGCLNKRQDAGATNGQEGAALILKITPFPRAHPFSKRTASVSEVRSLDVDLG